MILSDTILIIEPPALLDTALFPMNVFIKIEILESKPLNKPVDVEIALKLPLSTFTVQ